MRKNKGIIGFFKGFKYAFKGIVTTLKSERNMRIHLGVGLNVLIFALFIGVSMTEYAVLFINSVFGDEFRSREFSYRKFSGQS